MVRFGDTSPGGLVVRNSHMQTYLTVKAAARYLGVSPNTLRNWDRDGKIAVYRHPLSKYRLFKEADLDEVLRQIERSGSYPSGAPATNRKAKPR